MKNVTLSAKEDKIEQARHYARERHTTLNQLFRDWLDSLESGTSRIEQYEVLMESLNQRASPGKRRFTREEMNER